MVASFPTYLLSLVSFVLLGNVCTSLGIFCSILTGGGGGGEGQKTVSRKFPNNLKTFGLFLVLFYNKWGAGQEFPFF